MRMATALEKLPNLVQKVGFAAFSRMGRWGCRPKGTVLITFDHMFVSLFQYPKPWSLSEATGWSSKG